MLNVVSVNSEKYQAFSIATEGTSHDVRSSGRRSVVVLGIHSLIIVYDLTGNSQPWGRYGSQNVVDGETGSRVHHSVGKSPPH